MAPTYNDFYDLDARVKADYTQQLFSLTKDDQLIDIGGGTALISLMIHSDLGMTKPVVCVDPSREMLDVARKNGAITVQATAESFLASKPDYPLKHVLMNNCAHHFTDNEFVFTKLAEYMPEDGICIITKYPVDMGLPFFKAAVKNYKTSIDDETHSRIIEATGLKCRRVFHQVVREIDKQMWYDSIRNRVTSVLIGLSDEELEQGIEELEEQLKDQDVLKCDVGFRAIIITQK